MQIYSILNILYPEINYTHISQNGTLNEKYVRDIIYLSHLAVVEIG
jgi:hypothetical protein